MPLYLINALGFALAAMCWGREGLAHVICAIGMAFLAVINGALAAPLLHGWLQ